MFRRKGNLMSRKFAEDSRPSEKHNFDTMLRRPTRKDKFMGKMSDIIRKELQSESDDMDDEDDGDFLSSTKLSKRPCVKVTPIGKQPSSGGALLTDSKVSEYNTCRVNLGPRIADFSLTTDTEDDEKATPFDLPPLQNSLGNPPEPSFDLSKAVGDSTPAQDSGTDKPTESILPDLEDVSQSGKGKKDGRKKKKSRGVLVLSKTSSTRYYKQQYRPAWEQEPDFKGWLSGVAFNPSKAKCIYCDTILAAHSVSLMKHVVSSKHQRNAEKAYIMNSDLYVPPGPAVLTCGEKNNPKARTKTADQAETSVIISPPVETQDVNPLLDGRGIPESSFLSERSSAREGDVLLSAPSLLEPRGIVSSVTSDQDNMDHLLLNDNVQIILAEEDVDDPDGVDEKDNIVTLNDLEDVDTLEEEVENELIQVVKIRHKATPPKQPENKSPPSSSSCFQPISTHVIDSQMGLPVPNLEITLYKLVDGRWRFVSEIITNAGGRASSFVSDMAMFQCGRYKLHYHVVKYFEKRNIPTVFSFVEVAFDVRSLTEQLHFPLVVSANGYSVYKGCAL